MKIFKYILATIIFFIILGSIKVNAINEVNIYFFYGEGCPHCAKEEIFFEELKKEYSNINIHKYETWFNRENQKLFVKINKHFNINASGIPVTIIGENSFIGFNDTNIKDSIKNLVKKYSEEKYNDVIKNYINSINDEGVILPSATKKINVPFFGELELKNISLPAISIILGLIDGFNPCAMWILIFLISMLLGMKDKKRMWILGLTFLFTSAFIYLLFMLAWLNFIEFLGAIVWIKFIISFIAIIGGIINIRSYIKNKNVNGCTIVNEKKRNKIFNAIKKITHEKSFILALSGIIVLAISVNVVELACSAGLPVVFTGILKVNDLTNIEYFIYLLLYIFMFLLDDIIVFSIAMITLKISGISTKFGKFSHLIGGIIMILIGILLITKPEWIMFNF